MKPLHNICEYLHALHIYTDEARRGEVRTVNAHHFCSHVRKGEHPSVVHAESGLRLISGGSDLRQCLIYDSWKPDARLIGVEFMIPKEKYEQLDPEEQKYCMFSRRALTTIVIALLGWHDRWARNTDMYHLGHSHEFEVKSGMLVLPYPESHRHRKDAWDELETKAMEEVVGLYGKLYHFWEVDKGHDLPLGPPKLMGSLTGFEQLNVDKAMAPRNQEQGIDQAKKRELREHIPLPGIPPNADNWWKDAQLNRRGLYAA
ncbi:hypothetical protein H2202_004527 [Exophiala xenobiotica]|nr:hypothetical protein H2202_004527 [Exophiala xenobiotica]